MDSLTSASGLEAMRAIMQSGIRPLVARLYDPEDTAFSGYDLPTGGCLLVVATAGLAGVATAEGDAVKSIVGSATELGEEPWLRWQKHRFDLSAERLRGFLEPPGVVSRHDRAGGALDCAWRASYEGQVRNSGRRPRVMPLQSCI